MGGIYSPSGRWLYELDRLRIDDVDYRDADDIIDCT